MNKQIFAKVSEFKIFITIAQKNYHFHKELDKQKTKIAYIETHSKKGNQED